MGGGRGGRQRNPKGGRCTKNSLSGNGRHENASDYVENIATLESDAVTSGIPKSDKRGDAKHRGKDLKHVTWVTVQSMSGEVLELELWRESRIINIKAAISDHWKWPPLCQQLVLNDMILDNDSEPIAVRCSDDSQFLCVSLIVSQDTLLRELTSAFPAEALNQCVTLGTKATDAVVEAVRVGLKHTMPRIRRAAIKALTQVTDKGNQGTIRDVSILLGDSDSDVRNIAVGALGIIGKGNPEAAIVVICVIEDPTDAIGVPRDRILQLDDAKHAAIRALAQVADKNDLCAVKTLSQCLSDNSSKQKVSSAAVDALCHIVERGNRNAIKELATRKEGREAVLKVISQIAEKGDQLAIDTVVIPFLSDISSYRYSLKRGASVHVAAETLAEMTASGDQCVIGKLMDVITQQAQSGKSCYAHADALAQIAEKGDQQVISAVCTILEGPDMLSEVKISVLGVLEHIAKDGDERAIQALVYVSKELPNLTRIASLLARLRNHNLHVSSRTSKAVKSDERD